MYKIKVLFSVMLFILTISATTVTLQNGFGGYIGCEDSDVSGWNFSIGNEPMLLMLHSKCIS